MEIYVQSRGPSPDHDYSWSPEIPPHLNSISGLIQSESFSVVLARFPQGNSQKLILLVTGLESPEKRDFCNRTIRHSVVWVCDESDENEKQIRGIAAQALKGSLGDKIDECISFNSTNNNTKGFDISKEDIIKKMGLSEEIDNKDLPGSETSFKIAKNSQKLRNDLADQLQTYKIPKEHKNLIVVTGIKPEKTLRKAKIWRSLSDLVESEDWQKSLKLTSETSYFSWIPKFAMGMSVAIMLLVFLIPLTQQSEMSLSINQNINSTIEQTQPKNLSNPPNLLKKNLASLDQTNIRSELPNELKQIARFLQNQQAILKDVKAGQLSQEDKKLLKQVKADLKKYLSQINQIESSLGEKFD